MPALQRRQASRGDIWGQKKHRMVCQTRAHPRLTVRNGHQARFSPIRATPSTSSTLASICSAFMPATSYMSAGLA